MVTALAGLLNGDREVMSIVMLNHGGPAQWALVTWDLATEQLILEQAIWPGLYLNTRQMMIMMVVTMLNFLRHLLQMMLIVSWI